MPEPITLEHLAEIRDRDAALRRVGATMSPAQSDRRELLAEVDRLNQRVIKLEGDLSALRGWTRSRLHVLADRRSEYPETPEQRGKTEVLDDLTRVLDHLDTIPAPDATTAEGAAR